MITSKSKFDYPIPNNIPPGKKIRLARLARYMSTRQLAEMVGMTHGWVNQIERGELRIKVDMYERIQAALGYNFNTPEAEAAFAFFLNNHEQQPD
jgi:transcriptional regulator with XRE-family HTH domain